MAPASTASTSALGIVLTAVAFFCFTASAEAQTSWRQPSPRITSIVDTLPTPSALVSPCGGKMFLQQCRTLVPLSDLAQPMLRLGGIRFHPASNTRQRTSFVTGGSVLDMQTRQAIELKFPPGVKAGYTSWSPDGEKLATVCFTPGGSELWLFDPATGMGKCLARGLNDLLSTPYQWEFKGHGRASGSFDILANIIPENRGDLPPPPEIPPGPFVEESSGKLVKARTYQDLLKTPYDDRQFAYFAASQLVRIDIETASATPLGLPGLLRRADPSPDGRYILTDLLMTPFSHAVPADLFSHAYEVWDASSGTVLQTIVILPAGEQIPINGVPTGPRAMQWLPIASSTLFWAEALDGGDPLATAAFRDRLFTLPAPFSSTPTRVTDLPQRFDSAVWLATPGTGLITDYDEENEWITTRLIDTLHPCPASASPLLFSLSTSDSYNDPGTPMMRTLPDGQQIARMEGSSVWMTGDGATPEGNYPFLRKLDIQTREFTELFRAASGSYEYVSDVADASATAIVTWFEGPSTPPNYRMVPLPGATATESIRLTSFPDPAPELTAIRKELIHYSRADGIPLSGTLYYPVGYATGTRVPTIVWAYPREYTASDTAAQVRAEPNRFTQPQGTSILFMLLNGYAVLMDAEIPVVGKPREANDTFVEQITAGAKAAVDELVRRGIAERHRIAVAGHSYGAAMVANLLAHTDLFAAGIARSGAYNRSLTPFGFQGERRTYWQAPDVYNKLSAFSYADNIKEPLLMVHGELDNNTGTYPLQSERLFAAVRGHGGTVRLVVLPCESHGYKSREGVLHTHAETEEWLDRYLGRRPTPPEPPRPAATTTIPLPAGISPATPSITAESQAPATSTVGGNEPGR